MAFRDPEALGSIGSINNGTGMVIDHRLGHEGEVHFIATVTDESVGGGGWIVETEAHNLEEVDIYHPLKSFKPGGKVTVKRYDEKVEPISCVETNW